MTKVVFYQTAEVGNEYRILEMSPTLPDHVEIFDLQFNGRIIKNNFGGRS